MECTTYVKSSLVAARRSQESSKFLVTFKLANVKGRYKYHSSVLNWKARLDEYNYYMDTKRLSENVPETTNKA